MKSELEIRKHRDNLRVCMKIPCGCEAGGRHEERCFRGLMMMNAVEKNLSWVLGEGADLEDHVARLEADANEYRAKLN